MGFRHRFRDVVASQKGPRPLDRLRAAAQYQRNGVARTRIALAGDSNTGGIGAWTPTLGVDIHDNARVGSYPYQAASVFADRTGLKVSRTNFFGFSNRNSKADYTFYNPRVTFVGLSWTTGVISLGGYSFMCPPGTSDTMVYSPEDEGNEALVWYIANDPLGLLGIYVDGVLTVTVDTSKGSGIQSVVVPCGSTGMHVISFANVGASGNVHVVGTEWYDNTFPEVAFLNIAHGGSRIDDWTDATSAWSPANALIDFAPHFVCINLGINDERAGPLDRPWIVYYDQLIQSLLAIGADVVLTIPFPIDPDSCIPLRQKSFANAIAYLADKNGLNVIDLQKRMGTFGLAQSAGYVGNEIHMSAAGYLVHAEMLCDLMVPAFAGLGETVDPDAAAIIAAMTALGDPPTDDEARDINVFVSGLKADGDWAAIDALYVFMAQSLATALLNWRNLSRPATAVGTLLFAANDYVSGDGATSYIQLEAPSDCSQFKAALNGHGGDVASNEQVTRGCGCQGASSSAQVIFQPRSLSDQFSGASVSAQAPFAANDDARGLRMINRSGNTLGGFFEGGRVANITPSVSTTVPTVKYLLGAYNNNGAIETLNARKHRMHLLGGNRSGQAQIRMARRWNTFRTARISRWALATEGGAALKTEGGDYISLEP